MNKIISIGTLTMALVVFVTAEAAVTGSYAGAGLGLSSLSTPDHALFNAPNTSLTRNPLGGRIFAGYNFTRYLGLEANYLRFANATYEGSTFTNSSSIRYTMHALDLVGKGYLPMDNSGFNAYILGGLAEVMNNVDYHDGGVPLNNSAAAPENDSHTTLKIRPVYGIGVSYDVTKHVTTHLEFSRIQGVGNSNTNYESIPNADLMSLNFSYNFN